MELRNPEIQHHRESRSRPGFTSFKCSAPIRYPSRVCRDALIQATLDGAWDRLDPLTNSPGTQTDNDHMFGFFAWAGDKRFSIAINFPGGPVTASDLKPRTLLLAQKAILAEPHLSATRSIWSFKDRIVPLRLRMNILSRVQSSGGEIRVSDLAETIAESKAMVVESIFAMLCQGGITLQRTSADAAQTVISARKKSLTNG